MAVIQPAQIVDMDAEFGGSAEAPPAIPPRDRVLAERQAQEDAKLQKLGWRAIGVSEEATRLMESFEQFAGGKVMRTIDVTHGSMMRTVASSASRMVWLEAAMDEIQRKPADQITDADLMKLQMYHDQWKDCAKINKDCNGEAVKAAHVRVLMAAKLVEQEGKKRNKKAAWKRAIPTSPARTPARGPTA